MFEQFSSKFKLNILDYNHIGIILSIEMSKKKNNDKKNIIPGPPPPKVSDFRHVLQ